MIELFGNLTTWKWTIQYISDIVQFYFHSQLVSLGKLISFLATFANWRVLGPSVLAGTDYGNNKYKDSQVMKLSWGHLGAA